MGIAGVLDLTVRRAMRGSSMKSLSRGLALFLLLFCCWGTVLAQNLSPPEGLSKDLQRLLRRPDWGKVLVPVLDAKTHQPVQGARVAIWMDGHFPTEGKGTAETNQAGLAQVSAPLGDKSSSLHWGRLLTSIPLSLIFSPRSILRIKRQISLTGLGIRVEHPDYKPFLGWCPVWRRDADRFQVTLGEVYLVPKDQHGESFALDRPLPPLLKRFEVSPSVVEPGGKVELTLELALTPAYPREISAYVVSQVSEALPSSIPLKVVIFNPGEVRFKGDFKVPSKVAETAIELHPVVFQGLDLIAEFKQEKRLLCISRKEHRSLAERLIDGYSHQRLGDLPSALEEFQKVYQADPHFLPSGVMLGSLLVEMGRYSEAQRILEGAIQGEPQNEQALVVYTSSLISAGQWDQARRVLGNLKEGKGEKERKRLAPELLLLRARILAHDGLFEAAEELLIEVNQSMEIPEEVRREIGYWKAQKALKDRPEDPDVYSGYARSLVDQGRLPEALEYFHRSLSLDPHQAWVYYDLGQVYEQMGQRQKAKEFYQRVLQENPRHFNALLALAQLEEKEGRYEQARQYYAQALELRPRDLQAQVGLGRTFYREGEEEAALSTFAEALLSAPPRMRSINEAIQVGWVSFFYLGPRKKLWEGYNDPLADQLLLFFQAREEVQHHPESWIDQLALAFAFYSIGLYEEAQKTLEPVLQSPSPPLFARRLQANLLVAQGKMKKAQEELERLSAENPLHPFLPLDLAHLLASQGHWDQTQQLLLKQEQLWPQMRLLPSAISSSFSPKF